MISIEGQEGCHVYHGEAYLSCNLYLSWLNFLLKRLCVNGIVDIRYKNGLLFRYVHMYIGD